MAERDDAQQVTLAGATGGKDRYAADWQDAAMANPPDPLTKALEKVNAAGYQYQVEKTVPVVTKEMGETPRVNVVHVIRTTAWPKDGPVDADPPRVFIPVCGCPHFGHRVLPHRDDLTDANPPLADILHDEGLRCDHLVTAMRKPDVRALLDDQDLSAQGADE